MLYYFCLSTCYHKSILNTWHNKKKLKKTAQHRTKQQRVKIIISFLSIRAVQTLIEKQSDSSDDALCENMFINPNADK